MSKLNDFIDKNEKLAVVEYENTVVNDPLVSVCIVTYQHSKFIRKCIEGAIRQKTNFPFEVLVGEDDSDDGTREICQELARKYPDKIKLFLHSKENKIELYGKPTGLFNYRYNIFRAQGKYIALCDGDDYWTNPLKLQKQVDFLELNKEYGMIFSDTDLINEHGNVINNTPHYKKLRGLYKSGNIFWELLEKNFINTLTTVTRKEYFVDFINDFGEDKFSFDYSIWLYVASKCKIKYLDEKLTSYRIHGGGVSSNSAFFRKRLPLVQQSALCHYLSIVKYDKHLIHKRILSKVSFLILQSSALSIKDKRKIYKHLMSHPQYLFHLMNWMFFRFFTKSQVISLFYCVLILKFMDW